MTQTTSPALQPTKRLIRRLLAWLAPDWAKILLDAWESAVGFLRRGRHSGPYEILDYDAVLELRDAKGRTALFKRRQKVRFLQDGVTSYQYEAWGDGDPFASLKCSPGVVADRYRHGHRHVVLISLRETKNRGDAAILNLVQMERGKLCRAVAEAPKGVRMDSWRSSEGLVVLRCLCKTPGSGLFGPGAASFGQGAIRAYAMRRGKTISMIKS